MILFSKVLIPKNVEFDNDKHSKITFGMLII